MFAPSFHKIFQVKIFLPSLVWALESGAPHLDKSSLSSVPIQDCISSEVETQPVLIRHSNTTSADAANFERLACEYIFGSLKKWPNAGRQAPPEARATQER